MTRVDALIASRGECLTQYDYDQLAELARTLEGALRELVRTRDLKVENTEQYLRGGTATEMHEVDAREIVILFESAAAWVEARRVLSDDRTAP